VIEYARKIERGEERESKRRYERVGENERDYSRVREVEYARERERERERERLR